MSFLTPAGLAALGLSSLGEDVRISDRASIYNAAGISIGNNVRIDDFCVLSAGVGGICIGDHVHMAVGSLLIGAGRITLSSFCNVSSRVAIYSSSDDYSGETLTNPTVPAEYKNVTHGDVFLGRHVIVGSGSVVLPGTTLATGVAIGALSLVNRNCEEFSIYAGTPARRIGERKRDLLALEQRFLESNK